MTERQPATALLTPAEVARRLAVSTTVVRRLIRSGHLEAVLVSPDPTSKKPIYRIERCQLEAFMAERTRRSQPQLRVLPRRTSYERIV